MVVAVVNVGAIAVLESQFKSFPRRLCVVLLSYVLRSFRLVKDSSLTFNTEILAQLIKPLDN